MLNPDSTSLCSVLYVDDEEKALKYFQMAYASKFQIFTAISPEEAMQVLRREPGIGIVVSDQRMPHMLGSQFLGIVREEYPCIVRILTTAFTDLPGAIEAVNTGHIYQYVVKPWVIAEVGMVLLRAADYFRVLTERNELLAVKMTTLQRIVCSDRLKWLLLWSRGLTEEEQSAFRRALAAIVKALPLDLNPLTGDVAKFSVRQFEIVALLEDEYKNAAICLDALDAFRAGAWEVETSLQNLVAAIAETAACPPADLILETGPKNAARILLPVNALVAGAEALRRRLFGLLIEREAPALSLVLFQALLSLARAGGSLEIASESGAGDLSLDFFPAKAAADAEEVIHLLGEKFSTADISRL